jgi:hypothetical protein
MNTRPTSQRDERGAFLVLFALLIVALMTMVAIVIDLGRVRETRRNVQNVSDLAALAAGKQLAGIVSGGTANADPKTACLDAFDYIQRNLRDLPSGSTMEAAANAGNRCSDLPTAATCKAQIAADATYFKDALATLASGAPPDPYVITIRYPIPAGQISGIEATSKDGVPCERMGVTIKRDGRTFFGSVIGANNLRTGATAIVRGTAGTQGKQVTALLLLERRDCTALQTSGQGSVVLEASDDDHPGTLQADTFAQNSQCQNNLTTPGGVALYGTQLPSGADRPNEPSIVAQRITSNTVSNQGVISLWAIAAGSSHTYYQWPNGIQPRPTSGAISSRQPVDLKYKPRVDALKQKADGYLSATGGQTLVQLHNLGYTVFPDDYPGQNCNNIAIDLPVDGATIVGNGKSKGQWVYANCSTFDPKIMKIDAERFLAAGRVNIGSNNVLWLPNATEVVVAGDNSSYGINNQGTFVVNNGARVNLPISPPATSSNTRCDQIVNAPADGGTPMVPAGFIVVQRGPFQSTTAGTFRVCQVTMLMEGGASGTTTYDADTGNGPTCPQPPSGPLPCPHTNTQTGAVSVFNTTVDWSSPNQSDKPMCTAVAPDPCPPGTYDPSDPAFATEDLALWTEASTASEIKGQGSSRTLGVFFLPNARFTFSGQASQTISLNAQFISRYLSISGQGTLKMKPSVNDSVQTDKPTWGLIR